MSNIIAIANVPSVWDFRRLMITLARCLRGQFEGLNFGHQRGKSKVAYISLHKTLNPDRAIEIINNTQFKFKQHKFHLHAHYPRQLPNLDIITPSRIPSKTAKHLRIPQDRPLDRVVIDTHTEFMFELQCKYGGLTSLSEKMDHQLLIEIGKMIFDRLLHIVTTVHPDLCDNGFKLSKAYRKAHPHFADFQMILTTLHRLEDAAGVPRTQLIEQEFSAVPKELFVSDKVPYSKISSICTKYANRIVLKAQAHIDLLKGQVCAEPTNEEEAAQAQVKSEIVKMAPYIDMIIREVMISNFEPQSLKSESILRMRVYGEPFLPAKELLTPVMKKHGVDKMHRSDFMYNMLKFNMAKHRYTSLMQLDGTVMGTSKLVFRISNINEHFRMPAPLARQMLDDIQAIMDRRPM